MRLIDADALIDSINLSDYGAETEALETIAEAPTIDAVEVVRCRDCIYYQDNNDGYPHDGCRWRSNETPDADDFCSMAERRRR